MAAFASKLMEKVVRAAWRGGLKGVALGDAVPQTPWDLSLYACSSKVMNEGRAVSGPPPCCSQASSSALGSLPSVALSSAGAKGVFPISVPVGVYRVGNGKRQFELIAFGVTNNLPLS